MAEGATFGLMDQTEGQGAPIIVTALMGAADFGWADGLRQAHFPAERNKLPAHITLFHHLPPSANEELAALLARMSVSSPPEARLADVMNLGRGVAFRVESPALLIMRNDIADAFQGLLTPQDAAPPRLHITVQNKVRPEEARALLQQLRSEFKPRPLVISGLAMWWYRGGPWELIRRYSFRG
ncbi:MAG: 2'-5' RNA ligase family protein [Sphingobium sp.]